MVGDDAILTNILLTKHCPIILSSALFEFFLIY
jgi:hypothetical protein